jgi:hypothetical protein
VESDLPEEASPEAWTGDFCRQPDHLPWRLALRSPMRNLLELVLEDKTVCLRGKFVIYRDAALSGGLLIGYSLETAVDPI